MLVANDEIHIMENDDGDSPARERESVMGVDESAVASLNIVVRMKLEKRTRQTVVANKVPTVKGGSNRGRRY